MVTHRNFEILFGILIVVGVLALLVFTLKISNFGMADDGSYELTARFENIGGLKVRSPVNVSGVRIGRVTSVVYNTDNFEAFVRMKIDSQYNRLPVDSMAQIYTAGLLGEQYVSLQPGSEQTFLKDEDEITNTESALILERVISDYLFKQAAGGSNI
jgi:phospholipid/cholesterol/gamma-HCH transport system substrate-binding protein